MKKILIALVLACAPVAAQQLISDLVVQRTAKFTGAISPTQISSNQNDYAPTSFSTAFSLRLSSDASRNVTGLAGGAEGRLVVLHNVGSFDIVLKNESGSSTSTNRFALGLDVTIPSGGSFSIQYDGTSSRWRGIGGSSSAVGTVTHTGGALTSNSVVLGAGTDDIKVISGMFTDGTSKLTLGQTGTSVGGLLLANATSGTVEFRPVTGALGTAVISVPAATDTLALLAAAQTFTNKTHTSPKIGTSILDTNGNSLFILTATGSAVNALTVANASTSNAPSITASGSDTDIAATLGSKGIGAVNFKIGSTIQAAVRQTSGGSDIPYFVVGDTTYTPLFPTLTKLLVVGVSNDAVLEFSGNFATGTSGLADWIFTNRSADTGTTRVAMMQVLTGATKNTATITFHTKRLAADSNPTRAVEIAASGVVTIDSTVSSTTTGTGAEIIAGGLGVAENINAGGDIATQTIGKTLFVKSGSNAKSGTFTLSSGLATVTNSSVTANSVIVACVKTSSGTLGLFSPEIVINAGTGFSATGAVTDNSTYNFVIIEVN